MNQRTFFPRKELLISHSSFFSSALQKKSPEAGECVITFAEHSPETFEIFYNFIYTGHIYTSQDGDCAQGQPPAARTIDSEWLRLSQAWILGEKLCSVSFRDSVVDAVIHKIVSGPRYALGIHGMIYPNAPTQRGMKKLCVDVAVWLWSNEGIATNRKDANQIDFWFDVAVAMNKTKWTGLEGTAPFRAESTCGYHDHGEDGQCYKTMF